MKSKILRGGLALLAAMVFIAVDALVFRAWLAPGNVSLWLQAWIPGLCA
ncbi:MAG: hypothetical protein WDO68_30435 [Gammaproteobacteria bacterium]